MTVYTMGFTQKTAREFFGKIRNEQIDLLIDIRLNNNSQLAGFAKGKDLDFFLSELCGCKYVHKIEFAPTKELLDDYKKNRITWDQYVEVYHQLMDRRDMVQKFAEEFEQYDKVLLLCSEVLPDKCHRRLLAEAIKETYGYEIKHL